ncbi:MAG: DUF2325 domain-containing protein [Betaproteobacteria bacterium]
MSATLSVAVTEAFRGPPLAVAPAPSRRRKLREVSTGYHCAIIGTCVPMEVLRRLARRAGVAQWNAASDYELHHVAVHLARERTDLSRLLQKELEARYAPAVARFAEARTETELLAAWKTALADGEVSGALWALMTHPRAGASVQDVASQDVHMLSHQAGASMRADLRRLVALEEENAELREEALACRERAAAQLAERDRRIAALEAQAAELHGLQRRAEEDARRLTQLEEQAARAPVTASPELAARLETSEAARQRAQAALADARAELDASEQALRVALTARDEAPRREPTSLGGRTLLYVGGRSGLLEQYRTLVERHDGRFVHHDGGLEQSLRRLQPLLAAADAVVCGAGNVSHAAYYVVKRFAKRSRRPCVLLKNASLAAFSAALVALSGAAHGASAGSTRLN